MKHRTVLLLLCLTCLPAALWAGQNHVTMLGAPCRVADTRLVAAPWNRLPAYFPFAMKLRSGGAEVQGGTPGCAVPDWATGAIFMLTAVDPTAAGHLTAWPYDQPTMPLTAAMLYPAAHQNAAMWMTMDIAPSSSAFSIKFYATTDAAYTLDLYGYLEP